MLTGIDHFIVAVPSPDDAARELEAALGLRAGAGGRHEEYGSFNRLIWLGDSYIELLGVADPALAGRAWFGPKALEVLGDPGGGYVGMSFASDDLESDVAALRAGGSRLRAPEAGERARPDGRAVRWKVATLPEADAQLGHLFLIEHDSASAEWTAQERAARATEEHPLGGAARLERVELPVRDMKSASMHAHRDVGLQFRPSLVGAGARDSSVGRQTLRLVPGGPGIMPVVVVHGGGEARELRALGCLWRLEPAEE
ncbi:MAG TPA: VOC family protein [Candidatus Limnocylindria bacterium]|nr:VOC family protein [Candidatus Limnocylindria bacterium]